MELSSIIWAQTTQYRIGIDAGVSHAVYRYVREDLQGCIVFEDTPDISLGITPGKGDCYVA